MTGTATKKTLIAVGVLVIAYIAYPYFTLYRLGDAIRRGDAAPLESLVDWDRVREGIKEDVCDSVVSPSAAETAQNDKADSALPPFGESFVRGIASNVIDKNVTPSGLVSAAQQSQMLEPVGQPAPAARKPRANPRDHLGLLRWTGQLFGRAASARRRDSSGADSHSDGTAARDVEGDARLVAVLDAGSGQLADLTDFGLTGTRFAPDRKGSEPQDGSAG